MLRGTGTGPLDSAWFRSTHAFRPEFKLTKQLASDRYNSVAIRPPTRGGRLTAEIFRRGTR